LSYSASVRPDVLIFSGGIAQMPVSMNLKAYTQLPTNELVYGCFAEAMVLAASRRYEPFSTGQGCISLADMDCILEMAEACGFRPAPAYRGFQRLRTGDVENFLDLCERARQ